MSNQHKPVHLFWDAPLDREGTQQSAFNQLVVSACEDADSAFSLKVAILLRYCLYDDLLGLVVDPSDYTDPVSYLKDAQVFALIKKNASIPSSYNTTKEGIMAFLRSENHCAATNTSFQQGVVYNDPAVSAILMMARRKIVGLLGDCPDPGTLPLRFGPGAALSVNKYTSAYHKLKGTLDVTAEAEPAALRFLQSNPAWATAHGHIPCVDGSTMVWPSFKGFNRVSGSRLSFVPKTAKTDRPICIEPLMNGAIQKAYGTHIRNMLKRKAWVDLRNAQEYHRSLAQSASVDGRLATIDLSTASDSISYMFVLHMLPSDWFDVLSAIRSPAYTVGDKTYLFEKFSSMGNGYTFELETTLFLSIAKSVKDYLGAKGVVSCYGDDLIVPTECAELLIKVLRAVGFDTNIEKSFLTGPFRESCGGDYFNGIEVRPLYMKEALSPRQLTLLVNFLTRTGFNHIFPRLKATALRLLKTVGCLNFGPDNGTDGHVVSLTYPYGRRFRTFENRPLRRRHWDPIFTEVFLLFRQYISEELGLDEVGLQRHIERFEGFAPFKAVQYKLRRRRLT